MANRGNRRLGMEHRALYLRPTELRVVGDESKREVVARVINYNVADTYGSVWLPGCFTDGLGSRLPKIAWTHDWTEPIGRATGFEDTDKYLDLTLKFSDFEAVPQARRAYVQIRDGDIDQFSIGFFADPADRKPVPEAEQTKWGENIAWEYMEKAVIEEVSPVLVGSVPGTKTIAVRSALTPGLIEHVSYLLQQEVIDKDEARRLLEEADAKPEVEVAQDAETQPAEGTKENEDQAEAKEGQEVAPAEGDEIQLEDAEIEAALDLVRGR